MTVPGSTPWPVGQVDGVLLDIDDTLVDTRRAFLRAMTVLAGQYLPHLGAEALHQVGTRWLTDPGGHYRRYVRGEVDYRTQRRARADDLHATFGGPLLDDDTYPAWNAVFESTLAATLALHRDVPGFLAGLAEAGLPVGAVTNADVGAQTDKLALVGLADLPVLVGVDTLGVGKPDPRVFAEACRRLGTDPARTVYVGDELHVDAVAARSAGLLAVWLDRPGGRRVPIPDTEIAAADVTVVRTLSDLPTVMKSTTAWGRVVARRGSQ